MLNKHTYEIWAICQSKCLQKHTPHPLWWSKTRKKKSQDCVGCFLALLSWKPLFCPCPSCIAFLHTMRWKVNCLFWQSRLEWCKEKKRVKTRQAERCTSAEKTCTQKAKRSWNHWSVFTHWSFCFLRAACYLISGRQILSLTPCSTEPDSGVFKEWRNNKHPLRLDVRHSTKPWSIDVLLPPW